MLKALGWLKQNNSEYHDVAIDKMLMEQCVNVYTKYSHNHGLFTVGLPFPTKTSVIFKKVYEWHHIRTGGYNCINPINCSSEKTLCVTAMQSIYTPQALDKVRRTYVLNIQWIFQTNTASY